MITLSTAAVLLACTSTPLPLSGEQDGVYASATYVVSGQIVVRPGRTLTLRPGAVLLFEEYGGMRVEGELVCAGDSAQPVVFTSVAAAPGSGETGNPFDWNGITVPRGGRARLRYCRIENATFGVNADLDSAVILEKVAFLRLGQSVLKLGGEKVISDELRGKSRLSMIFW